MGGDLDTNSHHILLDDNHSVKFGDNADAELKHDGYSSLQLKFTSASTNTNVESSQVPPGLRIYNSSNTLNGMTGLYMASAGGQANTGIFARQLDTATSSAGQGCDMWFYTKRNGQSHMGPRAKFTNYGHFEPATNSHYDIGSSSTKFRHFYGVGGTFGNLTIGGTYSDTIENSVSNTNLHIQYSNAGDIKINEGGGKLQARNIQPQANNTYDLGTSSYRWRNIYTNDLHLSNVGHSNDMDGTWGDWTIQEGESDLFLKNNRSGKKYKFNLTEVS